MGLRKRIHGGAMPDDWPSNPSRFWIDGAMPGFWPPRPSGFWATVLAPLRHYYLCYRWRVPEVSVEGADELFNRFGSSDGVLIAPNHSDEGDPHVMMELARRVRRRFYFMAAWQLFRRHWGLNGWILQRMGAFSVDREGCDRRAVRQAAELLTHGTSVVVFPEGAVYHLNERLTPLLDGVAFMALTAQRALDRTGTGARVWIVPAAIRYRYVEDIRPKLQAAMRRLEASMFWWKPPRGALLHERIVRFGEVLLTIKEKEKLGRSCETEGDLATRIARLIDTLLERLESEYLKKTHLAETVPLRVKALRRRLLDGWADETVDAKTRQHARDALDDVQLVLQLYSYQGDYITEKPSLERMAETIVKFEQDINGFGRPMGKRRARVLLGEPMDVSQVSRSGRTRPVVADLTDRLERAIRDLVAASA